MEFYLSHCSSCGDCLQQISRDAELGHVAKYYCKIRKGVVNPVSPLDCVKVMQFYETQLEAFKLGKVGSLCPIDCEEYLNNIQIKGDDFMGNTCPKRVSGCDIIVTRDIDINDEIAASADLFENEDESQDIALNIQSDKIYDGNADKYDVTFIGEAYNDLLKLQGIDATFPDLVSKWIEKGLSVEDIQRQIKYDLNFDLNIEDVNKALEPVIGRKIANLQKISNDNQIVKYMSVSNEGSCRYAGISWQIKAIVDNLGKEKMYLVRVEEDNDNQEG